MEREHILVSEIVHFGKEAKNIEDEPFDSVKVQVFRNKEKERLMIIEMRQCDAEQMGINRGTRWRMKHAKNNKLFTLNKYVRERLKQGENGEICMH